MIAGTPSFASVWSRVFPPSQFRLRRTPQSPTVPLVPLQDAATDASGPITAQQLNMATLFNSGGSGTIYRLSHPSAGELAVKRLHVPGGDEQVEQIRMYAFREAKIWKTLKHENILPFIELLELDGVLFFVSPYVSNGSLSDYLRNHRDANIPQLLSETAAAVVYLHSRNFIHGDIKASNILVSADGHALLCDFWGPKGERSIRWESPELLTNGGGETYASDVWAFGMTIYEALSGKFPFHERPTEGVVNAILVLSDRPPKVPTQSTTGVSYELLWDVAEDCWKTDPTERMTMRQAHSRLRIAANLPPIPRQEIPSRGALAEGMLNVTRVLSTPAVPAPYSDPIRQSSVRDVGIRLQRILTKPSKIMLRSSEVELRQPGGEVGSQPPSSDTQNHVPGAAPPPLPTNAGNFLVLATQPASTSHQIPGAYPHTPQPATLTEEDVGFYFVAPKRHKTDLVVGYSVRDGKAVALRRVGKEFSQRYSEEAEIWRGMSHANLLEFVGILQTSEGRFLVSPWESNGSLVQYLTGNPKTDRARLIREAAGALVYLHRDMKIVHGNIRASNILVSKNITALLCDFGIVFTKKHYYTPCGHLAGEHESLRWRSPELIGAIPTPGRTFQSDVYAFGMTIYQVLSGHVPFYESNHLAVVLICIKRGDRPHQEPTQSPTGISYVGLWAIGSSSWDEDPEKRPTIEEAYIRLVEEAPIRPGSPDMRSARDPSTAGGFSDMPEYPQPITAITRQGTSTSTLVAASNQAVISTRRVLGKVQNLLHHRSKEPLTTSQPEQAPEPSSPASTIGHATPQANLPSLPAPDVPSRLNRSSLAANPEQIQLISTRRAPDPLSPSSDAENQAGDGRDRVFPLKVMDYGFKAGDKRRKIVKVVDLDNLTPLPPPAPGGFLRPLDADEIAKLDKEDDGGATLVADATHAPGFVTGWYRALYSFQAEGANEVSLTAGNIYECESRGGTPGSGWVIIAQLVGRQVQYGLAPERYLEFVKKW